MNIFASDKDPAVSARALDDKRVVKMILETAQMMCTVLHKYNIQVPYKPTHQNHPCTLWIGESKENFKWALEHLFYLNQEYKKRFNKSYDHKSYYVIYEHGLNRIYLDILPDTPGTPPPNLSTFNFDIVYDSYKHCLKMKWLSDILPPRWTNTTAPAWYLP